jgi:hypothetical protein
MWSSLRDQSTRPLTIALRAGALPGPREARLAIAIVNAFDHTRAVERSGITRLAAARRIKRRAVKNNGSPTTDAITQINYASFKLD